MLHLRGKTYLFYVHCSHWSPSFSGQAANRLCLEMAMQSWTLKVALDGEIRRCRPCEDELVTMAGLRDTVAWLFGGVSQAGLVLGYTSDIGHICSLTETTLHDMLLRGVGATPTLFLQCWWVPPPPPPTPPATAGHPPPPATAGQPASSSVASAEPEQEPTDIHREQAEAPLVDTSLLTAGSANFTVLAYAEGQSLCNGVKDNWDICDNPRGCILVRIDVAGFVSNHETWAFAACCRLCHRFCMWQTLDGEGPRRAESQNWTRSKRFWYCPTCSQ